MGRDADQRQHRDATAYHEAAHFIACRAVGCGKVLLLRRLTIRSEGGAGGQTIGYQKEDLSPSEIEDLVTILYAGQAASLRARGASPSRSKRVTSDEREAERLLAQLGESHAGRRLRRRAQRIVSQHWNDVELIARALLGRRTLEVDEAHRLLDGGEEAAERHEERRSRELAGARHRAPGSDGRGGSSRCRPGGTGA
jgi:ATP-dependent Zn protease